jgi:hypothetical protein
MMDMPSSKMLEGYCADVEQLLREGLLRQAVRLAVVLPEICTALESQEMRSSRDDYVRWCAAWLTWPEGDGRSAIGERLLRVHARATQKDSGSGNPATLAQALVKLRMRRNTRTHRSLGRTRVRNSYNRLQAFQVALCDALLDATRDWYREYGRHDSTVQTNIGKLLVSR